MQVAARPNVRGGRLLAISAFYALVIVGLAATIAFEKTQATYMLCGLIALPALAYVALRAPIIFPFGVYAVSVPFDPLLKAASGTGGTVTKFLGLITMACLLLHAYRLRRINAPPRAWWYWTGYLLWCFATWAWSYVPDETLGTLQIVGSLFVLFTIAAIYPITPRDYLYARRGVVVAGVLTALYGLYAFAAGQRLGTRLSLRSGNLQIDSNHYAAFFAIPIAILVARFFITRDYRERIVTAVLFFPMLVNVLLTGSRGGLIAVSAVLVYLGVRSQRYVLLGVSLVAGLALSFAVPEVWVRVFDPTLQDASGRNEIWNTGIVAMRSHGLFGSGFGTFPFVYDDTLHLSLQREFAGDHRPAHNVVVQTLVELGIPGLALLLAAWWNSVAQNFAIPRSSPYFVDRISYEAALIGIFISALTIDLIWFKYLWLCLMMVVLLANVVRPRVLLGTSSVERRKLATSTRSGVTVRG